MHLPALEQHVGQIDQKLTLITGELSRHTPPPLPTVEHEDLGEDG